MPPVAPRPSPSLPAPASRCLDSEFFFPARIVFLLVRAARAARALTMAMHLSLLFSNSNPSTLRPLPPDTYLLSLSLSVQSTTKKTTTRASSVGKRSGAPSAPGSPTKRQNNAALVAALQGAATEEPVVALDSSTLGVLSAAEEEGSPSKLKTLAKVVSAGLHKAADTTMRRSDASEDVGEAFNEGCFDAADEEKVIMEGVSGKAKKMPVSQSSMASIAKKLTATSSTSSDPSRRGTPNLGDKFEQFQVDQLLSVTSPARSASSSSASSLSASSSASSSSRTARVDVAASSISFASMAAKKKHARDNLRRVAKNRTAYTKQIIIVKIDVIIEGEPVNVAAAIGGKGHYDIRNYLMRKGLWDKSTVPYAKDTNWPGRNGNKGAEVLAGGGSLVVADDPGSDECRDFAKNIREAVDRRAEFSNYTIDLRSMALTPTKWEEFMQEWVRLRAAWMAEQDGESQPDSQSSVFSSPDWW